MSATRNDLDLATSVAGEEDPGASNEVGSAVESRSQPTEAARTMAPGDEAPPGTPNTGDDVCPDCGGSGKKAGGICPTCLGKGTVTVGIGGA
ncbi:MAG TPA: hypothetical protein VIE63_06810 [Ramlibacter sp.]|jgi:hypothetical protein